MPRGDECFDSGAQLRPQKWYGQRTLAIPRSISVVDLQTTPREQQQHGSRLRPSGPSFGNIREYERVASCKEVSKDPAQRNTSKPTRDNFAICSDEKRMRRKLHYKSYQELHILSMYQDDSSVTSSTNTDSTFGAVGFTDHHEPSSVYSDSDTSDSGNSSPYPRTPEETEFSNQSRSIQIDSESARNAKRGDARRVHVIEHRQNQNYVYGTDESESVPMQATVLTVPGKPRLIQIHRPQHTDHSFPEPRSIIDSTLPSTPKREYREVSTFSPYSTPASGTPFSDVSCTASEATPTPKLSIQTHLNKLTYRPFTFVDTLHHQPVSLSSAAMKQLADPFGSPTSVDSSTTIGTLFVHGTPPIIRNPSKSSLGTDPEKSALRELYADEMYEMKIRDAISSATKAFDALATGNFTTQSMEFTYFRSQHLNCSVDDALATSLRGIFPQASSFSRSTLAAWLIVDLHFKRLFTELPAKPPPYGIDLSLSDIHVFSDEKTSFPPGQSPSMLRFMEDQIHQPRYERSLTPVRPDRIPSKARSVLGIQTDPVGCKAKPFRYTARKSCRDNLEQQARAVHESVQTLGRKLIRDLLSPPTTPESASRQRSISIMPIRARISSNGRNNCSIQNEYLEDSARGLWEACRCIVSMA